MTATTTSKTNGKASKSGSKATSKADSGQTVPGTPECIVRAREAYGCAGPALMAVLKADGFDGKTLAERAGKWATATDDTVSNEPLAVVADVLTVDAPEVSSEPTTLATPEPELIPAGEPTPAAVVPVTPAPVFVPLPPAVPVSGGGGRTDLTDASRQWDERPADERFWSVGDALEATRHHKDTAREIAFAWDDAMLEPATDGRGINLVLPDGTAAALTHYATGQLCSRIKAPHQYLAKLPTDLAARCLTEGLMSTFTGRELSGNALVHQNGVTKLRSLTSDKYARFWNCEVYEALLPLTEQGWRTPPARPAGRGDSRARPATAADILTRRNAAGGIAVNVGDMIAPAGIYASDHDMFAFMVNEDIRIDDGTPDGLARGFFVSNSEVGAGALKVKCFYYRQVCGNHIVWGAEHVIDVSVRHVGTHTGIRQRFALECKAALDSFTSASVAEDQATVNRARNYMLTTAADPEAARKEVVQRIIAAVSNNRTMKPASGISVGMFDGSETKPGALQFAAQYAEVDRVHPYSLWGVVNGLTRYSQSVGVGADFADERARVDALVPKLLRLVGANDPAPILSA